jgi:hypothetical protein
LYYLIDFNDKTEGLYTLFKKNGDLSSIINGSPLPRHLMIVTDPDLESYSTIVPNQFRCDYTPISIDMVKQGISSVDAARFTRHLMLVGGMWEIGGLVKRIFSGAFEISISGGDRLYTSEIGLGEPDE